jgi:hypothetical protein
MDENSNVKANGIYSRFEGVTFKECIALVDRLQNGYVRFQSGTLIGSSFYDVKSEKDFLESYPFYLKDLEKSL